MSSPPPARGREKTVGLGQFTEVERVVRTVTGGVDEIWRSSLKTI